MTILRIEIISATEYNVFFEQDGSFVVDQCRDTSDIQRFNFAEIKNLIKSDPTIVDRPLPLPPFTEADRESFKAQAEAWLTPRRHEGFDFEDYKVSGDAEAQANFSGYMTLIQMGASIPFVCRDTTNIDHLLSVEQVSSLALLMAQFVQGCYARLWECKAIIESATTTKECTDAINTLQGY